LEGRHLAAKFPTGWRWYTPIRQMMNYCKVA
jgi:hypothetical protein